ncbi:MAG: NAD(P)-dependent oxidoreductase [Armatimonadota bacterium]|nr:NAD(P)-dependent oxidoreductase [Armatimonadota bacterium]
MRIAVTGGSGLIGRYVVRELAGSHEVTNLDLRRPEQDEPGVRFVQGDVLSCDQLTEKLAGHDAVVHLAGIPNPLRDPPERVFQVNAQGTFNALQACARNSIRNFVYASSDSTFGFVFRRNDFSPDFCPLDENHPLRPQDPYGLSKLVGEEICGSFARGYGMRTTALRPCWVWAPEEREMQRELVAKPEGWWKMMWAYVDVRDCARAFRLAVESTRKWEHEAFLITADDNGTHMESRDLVSRYYPSVQRISPEFGGRDSLLRCEKAKRILGYESLHSWRDFL